MSVIAAAARRLRGYFTDRNLISAGAVVAASMGEPALAHQLHLVGGDASADPAAPADALTT